MRMLTGIFFTLLLFSCSKEQILEPQVDDGVASATINGEDLDMRPIVGESNSIDGTYELRILYQSGRKSFYVKNLSPTLEKQILHKFDPTIKNGAQTVYTTSTAGEDNTGEYYELDEGNKLSDFIQLTSFDEETGEMVGTFQAYFTIHPTIKCDPDSPDNVEIINGYFETTVLD